MYKREVHERRVNQAKAKGIDVPADLLPTDKKEGGHNLIGQLEEMIAQVAPPKVSDDLVDQLLCYQQE